MIDLNMTPVAFATWGRRCGPGPVVTSAHEAIAARHDCARPYCDRKPVALNAAGFAFGLLRGKGGTFFGRRWLVGLDGRQVRFPL